MRRLAGQAALSAAMMLHGLVTLLITLAVLASVGLAAIVWRLSQGPVDLPWLTSRLEEAVNANGGPTRLSIGSAALAWEGFRQGLDSPLDLRLTNLRIMDPAGHRRMAIPQAQVSLSLAELVFGRLAPRTIVVNGPQFTVLRAPDGALSVDIGSLAEATDPGDASAQLSQPAPVAALLTELARPPATDGKQSQNALLAQLRRVRIHDAHVVMVDHQLGLTLRAPDADIDLRRGSSGGVNGTADVQLVIGEQQTRVTASVALSPGAADTRLQATFAAMNPKSIAGAAPILQPLSVIDSPVRGEIGLDLDANLGLRDARFRLRAGAGTVHIGNGDVPFAEAVLAASGTTETIRVQTLRVSLAGQPGWPQTHIDVRGVAHRDSTQTDLALSADLDQANFADLAQFWPDGTAEAAREWILENIPFGTARNGHVDLELTASPDLADPVLRRASGTLDGEGLQVHWLRPIPPIDNGQAQLRILDPDTLEIVVASGRERLRGQKETNGGGLQIRSGKMRITGIMQPHQMGAIEVDVVGSVPDSIALLREPRLGLLDRHPMDLRNPAGQATVKLSLKVPLEKTVRMDDISVRAQAHLDGVHLTGFAAERDLDQGVLDLDATADGLKLKGQALLAGISARLDGTMDFRAGPPTQIVQTMTISGQPDTRQLAAAGLDVTSVVNGPAQLQAVVSNRRNGQGDVAVSAELGSAELSVTPLDWHKPRDIPARASARLLLNHDRLIGMDNVQLDGPGMMVRGRVGMNGDRITLLQLDRLMLGRTIAQGTVRLPETPGSRPIIANLSGASLDLSSRFGHHAASQKPPSRKTEPPPGPSWTLDARFDRLFMANDRIFQEVALHAENDGRVIHAMNIEGRTGLQGAFAAQMIPDRTGRRFTGTADDAGELLRGLDYIQTMQGGRLSVQAHYDDAQPGRPLSGSADIESFRIRNAPALAKLLQAMTLYGLVEVVQGPGLGFSRLVAPFRVTDEALELSDARAFSSSLGLTLKGRLDLETDRIDMQGTIVPAYFFNALLGNIPLVGKLFSPERGGGVFAASYTVRGPLADPDVFVNPLTALTPGFLRGVFGLF